MKRQEKRIRFLPVQKDLSDLGSFQNVRQIRAFRAFDRSVRRGLDFAGLDDVIQRDAARKKSLDLLLFGKIGEGNSEEDRKDFPKSIMRVHIIEPRLPRSDGRKASEDQDFRMLVEDGREFVRDL